MSLLSCYQNILESSTVSLSQGSQNASYPLYRLYDRDIGRMFAGSAAATTGIKADQGALVQNVIDSLFIPAGHNLAGMQCGLSWSDDDATYTQAFPNLIPYSQYFGNSWWGKTNLTVVGTATTAPDGTLTAAKLVESNDSTSKEHYISSGAITLTPNTDYTFSAYVSAAGDNRFDLNPANNAGASYYGSFNLSTGTVTGVTPGATATITPAANGFYRCTITFPSSTGTSAPGFAVILLNSSGISVYPGNGVNGIYIWGAQLEAASSASPYDGTFGAAQTFTPAGSGLIQYSFPQGMTHRYWKFTITNPSAAPQFAELFLTSTYTWEKLPARPGGPFDDVFNIKTDTTSSGLDRFLAFGNSKRQRVYKVVNAGAAQQANITALNAAWAGSKPFWLYDHEGNWIYGRLRKPIGLKETGAGKFGFDFDFLEVLGS